eukprot:TRINITY_DN65700_c6_g4_i1.p1 TRINITY_DN65700_c6_g4~~TRINITY_DN65700_c6_g4_i1.p1  ORF type:complete len:415 (+),score=13.26 TRINITY_DN65700_c6_g4_i1:163-1245(+)
MKANLHTINTNRDNNNHNCDSSLIVTNLLLTHEILNRSRDGSLLHCKSAVLSCGGGGGGGMTSSNNTYLSIVHKALSGKMLPALNDIEDALVDYCRPGTGMSATGCHLVLIRAFIGYFWLGNEEYGDTIHRAANFVQQGHLRGLSSRLLVGALQAHMSMMYGHHMATCMHHVDELLNMLPSHSIPSLGTLLALSVLAEVGTGIHVQTENTRVMEFVVQYMTKHCCGSLLGKVITTLWQGRWKISTHSKRKAKKYLSTCTQLASQHDLPYYGALAKVFSCALTGLDKQATKRRSSKPQPLAHKHSFSNLVTNSAALGSLDQLSVVLPDRRRQLLLGDSVPVDTVASLIVPQQRHPLTPPTH